MLNVQFALIPRQIVTVTVTGKKLPIGTYIHKMLHFYREVYYFVTILHDHNDICTSYPQAFHENKIVNFKLNTYITINNRQF